MKTITTFILALMASLSINAATAKWNLQPDILSTNIMLWRSGAISNVMTPQGVNMSVTSGRIGQYAFNGITMTDPLQEIVATYQTIPLGGWLGFANYTNQIGNKLNIIAQGLGAPATTNWTLYIGPQANVHIYSNLWVYGSINSPTNILWATNEVWATNAFYSQWATNYVSLTNSQTVNVDFSKTYGDLDTSGTVTFTGNTVKTVDYAYQTAVILIHNTLGAVTNIVPPVNWKSNGSFFVTNETVCTVIRNPGRSTNIISLPLW